MSSASSSIGFALTAGFILYITVRGELPAYLCVVGIGTNCPTPPATVTATQNSVSSSTSSVSSSNTYINNPGITTTTIDSPPTQGNVGSTNSTTNGYPIVTSTINSPGGGASDTCDRYGDTDQSICDAINALGSGYNVVDGTDDPEDGE